eukprot:TRINITY_DN13711_c0_g1_i1.p1 TRINITY_DN13711_c0_g1~~TRINITY_DN13711_c0_g1_i1.p1  ORF type:complete len:268 (+),score=35.82 TRINITY_DN13711_c0_g1_i1:195-998(+)
MMMKQRSVCFDCRGASARKGFPSLCRWATARGFLGVLLLVLVVGVEGGLPTTNASLGDVAHGGAAARWGRAGLGRGGGDNLAITERPMAPPDVLPNPQIVAVAPPGVPEPITGVRFQPILQVLWKEHPRQPGLRGVQWMKAKVITSDLNTGRGTSERTRNYVRSLGADIRPQGGDQTGHLVANRLGGTGLQEWAVFPQLRSVNTNEFKRFEGGAYAKVQQFGTIFYFVKMEYNAPNVQWPLRPKSYKAAYCWVENKTVRWYGEAFPN